MLSEADGVQAACTNQALLSSLITYDRLSELCNNVVKPRRSCACKIVLPRSHEQTQSLHVLAEDQKPRCRSSIQGWTCIYVIDTPVQTGPKAAVRTPLCVMNSASGAAGSTLYGLS